jgi:uncharacterized pyridoxamine 5'-phosphate oxidase family protein
MNKVVDFLLNNHIHFLATVDKDGNPKVRPFRMVMEKEGKLYFCTSNKKEVFKELQNNPSIELCVCSKELSWLRLSGRAVFIQDAEIKKTILEMYPFIKSLYKTPDNPVFEIFYLENTSAAIFDFSDNPPETFERV